MFCVKCGKKIDEKAIFCPFCGVNLTILCNEKDFKNNWIADENHENVSLLQNVVNDNPNEVIDKNEKRADYKEKRTKKLSAYTIVVILLLLLLVVLFILIKVDIFGVNKSFQNLGETKITDEITENNKMDEKVYSVGNI